MLALDALLEHATIVFYPAILMSSVWIVVSPMNDTSLRVPFVFPPESNIVAFTQ